jgi:hypothetical protein
MDTDALIAHSRTRLDHAAAKRLLKEKYQAKLCFGYNGGMWRATPEMITFLSLYGDQEVIVPDLYENPTRFNARVMRELMQARWQEQMTAWLIELEQIQQQR